MLELYVNQNQRNHSVACSLKGIPVYLLKRESVHIKDITIANLRELKTRVPPCSTLLTRVYSIH